MISPLAQQVIPDRLRDMLAIETRIEDRVESLAANCHADTETSCLLTEIAETATRHAAGLRARIEDMTGEPEAALPRTETCDPLGPVDSLRAAFTLVSEAVIGYAALLPAANRVRDSPISASAGLSGHIARDYSQESFLMMGQITGMMADAVLRELATLDCACQCICPACGLGLCVCGLGATAVLNEAWLAARPGQDPPRMSIPLPRSTSAAAGASFREGDVLTACDGATLVSYPQLQTTIKSHEMGEHISFDLQRSGKKKTISVERSADLGDGDLPLDCEAPSGPVFYLDRAKDLQQRLRQRAEDGTASPELAALSPRETQVLRLVADGATNPMIAAKLHIQRPTVARHVGNILAKLNVTNRSEATAVAVANGLDRD
jgi:DNA-binding CsgD family transcriptional regulator